MAFSMKGVTSLKEKRKGMIRALFAILNNDERLTPAISDALRAYLNYMLNTIGNTMLKKENFELELDRLLAGSCDTRVAILTKYEIVQNETKIINNIKKAISLGGLSRLNYDKKSEFLRALKYSERQFRR